MLTDNYIAQINDSSDRFITTDNSFEDSKKTKIFISIVSLAGFFTLLLSGLLYTYLIFYSTKNSINPLSWATFYNIEPLLYCFGPTALLVSIGFIYLYFKFKTLSLSAWISAIAMLMITGSYLIFSMLIFLRMSAFEVEGAESAFTPSLIGFLDITLQIIFAMVALFLLVVICLKKKFNQNGKMLASQKFGIFIYSCIVSVLIIILYLPGVFLSSETPFIGFDRARNEFDKNPVFFEISQDFKQGSFVFSEDKKSFFVIYLDMRSYINGQFDAIIIRQQPTTMADTGIKYVDKDNGHAFLFIKNGYEVFVGSEDKNKISKETLSAIAESAK